MPEDDIAGILLHPWPQVFIILKQVGLEIDFLLG